MPGLVSRLGVTLGRAAGEFTSSFQRAAHLNRASFIGESAQAAAWSGGDYSKKGSQRRAYANPWVYSAVDMISREVSNAVFQVLVHTAEGKEPKASLEHPLILRLRRPNPWMGRAYLWRYTSTWLELDGNAYWFIQMGLDGWPAEIWPLPSQDVNPVPGKDANAFIDHYEYTTNGRQYNIPAQYIVHVRLPNPFDVFRGYSPLVVAMLSVDTDRAMALWNAAFFGRDNVMPSAVINLSSGDPSRPINPDDANRLREDLRTDYHASARRTAITTANQINAVLLGWNPRDVDFQGGRGMTKQEVLQIYGVPVSLVDPTATEANATAALRMFRDGTIWSLLGLMAEQLTAELVQPFYGSQYEGAFEDIRTPDRLMELQEIGAAQPYLMVDEVRSKYWKLGPLPDGRGQHTAQESPPSQQPASPEVSSSEVMGGQSLENVAGMLPGQVGLGKSFVFTQDSLDDLKRWQTKSVRAVKDQKPADVKFESDAIPDILSEILHYRLRDCKAPVDVREVFADFLSV